MLVIDDILLSPYKGLLWVFEEIHKTAVDELEGEAERIRNELTDLYMMLETGQIDDDEFDRRETALLDRLDQLEQEGAGADDDAEEDDADEDDERLAVYAGDLGRDERTTPIPADAAETIAAGDRERMLATAED